MNHPPLPEGAVYCYCGCEATIAIRMTNIPNPRWAAKCPACYSDHVDTCCEVNDHEMRHFGGAYGLISWEERPIDGAVHEEADYVTFPSAPAGSDVVRLNKASIINPMTMPPEISRALDDSIMDLISDESAKQGETPRTDEAYKRAIRFCHPQDQREILTDCCRALERELAEARAEVDELQRVHKIKSQSYDNLIETIEKEIDEFRNELITLRTALGDPDGKLTVKELVKRIPKWIPGPANGGEGTAGTRNGVPWWWDGDQLEVIFETNGGPEVMLVTIYADGDASMTISGTDEDPGYAFSDIAWYRRIGPLPEAPNAEVMDAKHSVD